VPTDTPRKSVRALFRTARRLVATVDFPMLPFWFYHLQNHRAFHQEGPTGAFAQEVTVLHLNVSQSENEIRYGMIIRTRIFDENPNI
jgi:hypothetical protein